MSLLHSEPDRQWPWLSFGSLGSMSEPLPSSAGSPRYSVEEQEHYRELFAPIAQKYRTGIRYVWVFFIISGVIMATGFLLPRYFMGWAMGGFFVCWLAIVILACTQPRLECPGCHGDLNSRELGSYCPECGAAGLRPGDWFQAPYCESCGKSLRRSRAQRYRVRACTHCGLMLDETGL